MLLRSGDVIVMSGPQCRRAYHGKYNRSDPHTHKPNNMLLGIPRILETGPPPDLLQGEVCDRDWKLYGDYIQHSRININVRQVFPSKRFEHQVMKTKSNAC